MSSTFSVRTERLKPNASIFNYVKGEYESNVSTQLPSLMENSRFKLPVMASGSSSMHGRNSSNLFPPTSRRDGLENLDDTFL
jgi:hypothetical protein